MVRPPALSRGPQLGPGDEYKLTASAIVHACVQDSRFRLTSFNVLSTHLANPASYPLLNASHLVPAFRWSLVVSKVRKSRIFKGLHVRAWAWAWWRCGCHGVAESSGVARAARGRDATLWHHRPARDVVAVDERVHHVLPVEGMVRIAGGASWARARGFAVSACLRCGRLCQGYTYVPAQYGRAFNGYMGVGIAFPTDKYELLKTDIACLADELQPPPGSVPRATREEAYPSLGRVLSSLTYFLKSLLKWMGGITGVSSLLLRLLPRAPPGRVLKPVTDPWAESLSRSNRMVSLKLKDVASGVVLAVSTYHMPCIFWAPSVMTIHTALAVQHAHVRVPLLCAVRRDPWRWWCAVRLFARWNPRPTSVLSPNWCRDLNSVSRTAHRTSSWVTSTSSQTVPCTGW